MNSKKIAVLLAAEGAVCAVLTFLMRGMMLLDAGVLAFPFAQLGAGLRALSLLGGVCNVLAVALYVCISLAPLALFTARALRRGFHAEDLLLPLLTLSLFGALYAMVNPAMLDSWIVGGRTLGLPVLGGVLYAEVLAYALLRLLRAAFSAEAARLRQYFTAALVLAAAVFVFCAFGSSLRTLLLSLDTLHTQNTASASDAAFFGSTLPELGWTEAFLVLRYAADAAPYVLDMWVILAALTLLRARAAGNADGAEEAAETVTRRCRIALSASVLAELALDLLQLLFMKRLRSAALTVTLPLVPLAFCLAALILARLVQENRKLRADNDLFI